MTISLYDATIPGFQQGINAGVGLLAKAEKYCVDNGLEPSALLDAKLADDMLPFGYQVKALWQHSTMAIDGVRAGVFSPDRSPWPTSVVGLNDGLTSALGKLAAITGEEISSFVGRDMAFVMGERRMEFTADGFLMSFSKPNFYFHLTTAYAIMRNKGVSVGKMDFLGRPRLKG